MISINIFQPVNWVFVQSSKVFPIDHVLMLFLVLFFFSSSVAGIANIGIRFLWIKIVSIRKGHTTPQALLMATVMLTLIMLAVNYAITMIVAPQYAIYGAQKFCNAEPRHPGEQPDCTNRTELILPCSELSEASSSSAVCTPTMQSTFLNRISINYPVLGGIAFWAQFAFLAVFLVVFVTSLFRTPKMDLSQLDEDAEIDEEEGLLASTGRRFNATWGDIRGKVGRKTSNSGYGTGSGGRGIRGDDTGGD